MKRIAFSLLSVVMLIAMALPAGSGAVLAQPSNWPGDAEWMYPANCYFDPHEDEHPAQLDLIGNDTIGPAAYYSFGTDYAFFRERVLGDPSGPGKFASYAWVVLFDLPERGNYEYLLSLNGNDETVELWNNTVRENLTWAPLLKDEAEIKIKEYSTADYARIVPDETGHYFVDWAIPLTDLTNLGIDANTTMYFATSADANNYNKDHLVCYNFPDLVITEKSEAWVSMANKTYNVSYIVCNEGAAAPAGASNTTITIDGVDVLEDPVPGLAAGVCYNSTVGPFTMSGTNDTIMVCADNGDVVDESNEYNNCMENIFVCELPAADFSANNTSPCVNASVQFTDLSTGTINSWSWDFLGGSPSSASTQGPHTVTYSSAGNYTVNLTVSNACGSDDEVKAGYITVGTAPTAAFSGAPTSGCAPLTVNFTDLSTGSPTGWSWDFGDGSNSTQQNPSHQYSGGGSYNVSLTVSNACGSDDEVKAGYITVSTAPTYNLTISSTSGGNVTTPGEGTFTYNASEVVDLVATADTGYQFVNWTGNVSTIANVNSANTTITMTGNYSIVGNFAIDLYNLTVAIEVEPALTKVGFTEDFDVEIWARVPPAQTWDTGDVHLNFSTTYMTVNSITGGTALPTVLGSAYNNTLGTIDFTAGILGSSVTGDQLICTVNCTSKSATGISTIDFVNIGPLRVTDIIDGGVSLINWTLVVDGTLKVGSPALTVDVSPAGKGDVDITGLSIPPSYPNVTEWAWDQVVTLEGVNPAAGWTFDHWSGDLAGSTNPHSVTMDSLAKNVTANFIELPPELCVDPSNLTFRLMPNTTGSKIYNITNCGGGTLNWDSSNVTYGPGATGWLTQNITNGTLAADVSDTVNVTANSTGLEVGTYNATITITGSTFILPIILEITEATTIDVMRDLPPDALDPDAEYPGDTFWVYVNFTALCGDFNSIGLTDLAPEGWEVETDINWCSPVASWTMHPYNKAEYAWSGEPVGYASGTNFSAKYLVTIPATAEPGIHEWPRDDCDKAWVEYWCGAVGPLESCITGEFKKVVTVPGKVYGETRDVNADLLDTVTVVLYEEPMAWESTDTSTNTTYENDVDDTGLYWQEASKYCYFTLNTSDMPGTRNPWHDDYINFTTVELLAAGYTMDFEGDYGLVPRACTMAYAMESVNHWLYVPIDDLAVPHPEWQLSTWKAMESVHSWQFPAGCNL